jgi:hypothetical protein
MIEKIDFKQYLKELDSFEFETVNYDRNNDTVYNDTTFKPIQLFRLPKYNQFETEYEKLIDSLAKDAYEEICFWAIEIKKNALKLLKEKKLKFKDYWEFEHKYHNLINEQSTDFDYIRFMLSFFSLFDIKVKNEGFVTNDGFSGNYGLVTIYAIEDLHEALMFKESSLDRLINRLENNLGLILPEEPPAEKTGFDLGLTEPQLIVLHKELIDNNILDKSVDCDNFIIVFRDEVLNDYKPLKWKNKTKGAVFVSYYFGDEINYWSNYHHLFEPADYKQLLYNSKNTKTFNSTIDILLRIDSIIKNIDRVGGK